ncbi:mucin-2-like isoform X2 [Biomphalaria glabrata]|uniref:Mucin-2-like isoform X2 n=1 Tax=Biomphalaria glabrata TaxID=6526 RepID=A0A9W2Z4N1_BIOGL|nr:mucin-2-like isoform X2 [Biomphalaria glabrata]
MSIMICVDSVNKGTSALPVIIIAPPRGESEFLLEMNTNEELVNRPSESCRKGQHTLNSSMLNSHHDITRDSNYLTLISGTSASSFSGVPTSIDATPRIVLATTEFPIMPSLCIAKNNCYLLNSSSPENHNVTQATMTLYKTEESVALSKPRTTQHLDNTTRSILHQSPKSCSAKDDHRQQNFLQQHRDPKSLSHLTGSFRTSFQENSAHVQTSSNLVSKSYTHNQLSSTHVSSQFAALPKKSFTKPSNLNEKPHKEGTRSLSSSLCYQTSADQTTTVNSTRCSPASSLADKSSSSVKSSTRSTSVHQYKLTNHNTSFNETVNAIEPMETFENTEPVVLQPSNSNIATSTRPSDGLYSQGASFINSPTSSYTGALTSNSATPANGAASGSFGKQNGSHNVLRMESSSSPQPSRIPVQCIAVKQPTSSNSSLPVTSFASFRSPTVSPDSHMSPPEFSVKDSIPSRAESVQEQSDISPSKCSPSSSASLVPSSSASLVPSCSTSMLDMPATKSTETLRVDSGRQLRARNKRKFLPEKTRHKRQTLQDMTRPLKLWLVKHRDNPYPSKTEKIELVKNSHMSIIQVSNWFANARRRLKNTVKGENVSWAKRIKAYNNFAEGNAELLSIPSSDEENWDSDQETDMDNQDNSTQSEPLHCDSSVQESVLTSALSDTALNSGQISQFPVTSAVRSCAPSPDDHQGSGQKFKHSILQRYLQQAILPVEDVVASSASRHRHLSSSTGSHDFEYLSTSSVSSPSHEVHQDSFDDLSEDMETIAIKLRPSETSSLNNTDELYWKEISAALALTSLARCHVTK